ncbi:MAG: tetratricopeptide repeat protein [Rhodospirillaceae bacterium]
MVTVPEALALALDHHQAGRLQEAEALYSRILAVAPGHADCRHRMGVLASQTGRGELAVRLIGEAIALDGRDPACHNNLGNALHGLGRLDEAAASYRRALALKPDYAGAHYNLASSLQAQGRPEAALGHFEQALALGPERPEVHNNLGAALLELGRVTEAVAHFERALTLAPDHAEARNNLGKGCQELGRMAEAVAHYRQALALRPGYAEAHSNLLMTLTYLPDLPAARLFAEHRDFGRRHACPALPHANPREPGRRLRIGYVSGDFRHHVVGFFIEPLLAAHDRTAVSSRCYSETRRPDAVTARIKALAEGWCETAGLDDRALAARIQADGIDLLIDLAGHSAFNRLPVFALKPAPVQVTWLGYPGSTGLAAIDYRLVDPVSDPEGGADRLASEALVRLQGGFLCYRPPCAAGPDPAPAAEPADGAALTFGSFNNLNKLSPPVLALWAALLCRLPGARLLLKSRQLADEAVARALRQSFGRHGVARERLELLSWTAGFESHLDSYRRVGIALDPFPYNGTTTTCEALWMGVPVVTLAGERHAARMGASLLTRLGLDELIAADPAAYLEIAAALATDRARLAGLRAGLRQRMTASPLCDAAALARRLETAYRIMWRRWCAGEPASPFMV